MATRTAAAQRAGMVEDKLTSVDRFESDPRFTERERWALRFTELLASNPSMATDKFFDDMRVHYTEGEIVELAFFLMACIGLHRFHTAIDLEAPVVQRA
jgi:alkylhydroperoxidase family enzyme